MAHVVSTSIAQLIQGVLSAMILQKLKLIAVACVVSGLFLTGAGVVARQQRSPSGAQPVESPEAHAKTDFGKAQGIAPLATEKTTAPRNPDPRYSITS